MGDRSVSSSPSSFYRGLSKTYLEALEALTDQPQGNWWRDVLARRDLVIAIRADYLNVYYRGAGIAPFLWTVSGLG